MCIRDSRGAALQQRGQAEPGTDRGEAIAQRFAQEAAQIGAERAQYAGEDADPTAAALRRRADQGERDFPLHHRLPGFRFRQRRQAPSNRLCM